MSTPPINPQKTVAGITVDPRTLERVIPESQRPDGSVRRQIKIRPGFTPQEDVGRFRGTKQAQMDSNALPKGHIIGWVPSPRSSPAQGSANEDGRKMSAAAKKNQKRRARKAVKVDEVIKNNWEDDDVDDDKSEPPAATSGDAVTGVSIPKASTAPEVHDNTSTQEMTTGSNADGLADKLEKLDVQ